MVSETNRMSLLNSIFSENNHSQAKGGTSKNKQNDAEKLVNIKNNSYDTLMQDEMPDVPLKSQRAIPSKEQRASHFNNHGEG